MAGDARRPVLVACSHGTASAAGRRAAGQLRAALAGLRPGLEVVAAYVDVQEPRLAEVVAGLSARGRAGVVVPLLLSAGYHVRVDVAAAVGVDGPVRAARPLGPDPVLVGVLADRLAQSGTGASDTVLLAASGSGDPSAVADVERTAAALGERIARPVTACFLAAAEPTVPAAVAAAVADQGRAPQLGRAVTVVTYLLSPGLLADRLAEQARAAGAARVTAPLAGHPAVAGLALARYDEIAGVDRSGS